MGDSFEIAVEYKGDTLTFNGELHTYGYSYKIEVEVYGKKYYFEPDEEKNFRVLIDNNINDLSTNVNVDLLKCIAEAIHKIVS